MNKISKKWKPVAKGWLGDSNGKHCHWCSFADFEEGEVTCGNPKSDFCDGGRIRTWDGLECAKQCGFFELDTWYTKDENFDISFKDANPSKKLNDVLGVAPWVAETCAIPGKTHYYINGDENKMQITLGNGLTISGSKEEVIDAMRRLGYGNENGKFYNSESKGLILISEMETAHLMNAIRKLNREWAESLSEMTDPQEVVTAIELGNQDETFIAMLDELHDRAKELF